MTRRPVTLLAALALVATACGGSTAATTTEATIISAVETETTTTTVPPTTSSTTTTTTLPAGPAIAQVGDNNETVEAMQFYLRCNGFGELTIDGAFGPASESALQDAQTEYGLTVNGVLDDFTFAALSRDCSLARTFPTDGEDIVTVVGNTDPEDPDIYLVELLENSTVVINVTGGVGGTVRVFGPDDLELQVEGQGTWTIPETGQYRIEVTTEMPGGITYSLGINLTVGDATVGAWILLTDGFSHEGTKFELGDDAQTVIDEVMDRLGHGIRGAYEEFDTDWYTIDDPQSLGLRGVFVGGFAMLFFGPHPGEPDRAETFERLRFEGSPDDATGQPRPDDYVTTAEGVTVGDTLAELEAAYGDAVSAGSNSEEHYYRFTDSGGELCFYFGSSEPSGTSEIREIATECRS